MSKQLVHCFEHVERPPAHLLNGRIRAKHLKIESVAIECYDLRKGFQFGDQLFRVGFKPAPEFVLFVPRYCNRDPEILDVRPTTWNFVRQPQRFNIQKNLAIEKSGRMFSPEMNRAGA